jgi:hypothetical protein
MKSMIVFILILAFGCKTTGENSQSATTVDSSEKLAAMYLFFEPGRFVGKINAPATIGEKTFAEDSQGNKPACEIETKETWHMVYGVKEFYKTVALKVYPEAEDSAYYGVSTRIFKNPAFTEVYGNSMVEERTVNAKMVTSSRDLTGQLVTSDYVHEIIAAKMLSRRTGNARLGYVKIKSVSEELGGPEKRMISCAVF